jgi:hypothetical protein
MKEYRLSTASAHDRKHPQSQARIWKLQDYLLITGSSIRLRRGFYYLYGILQDVGEDNWEGGVVSTGPWPYRILAYQVRNQRVGKQTLHAIWPH